jgi:hypothetical protein
VSAIIKAFDGYVRKNQFANDISPWGVAALNYESLEP